MSLLNDPAKNIELSQILRSMELAGVRCLSAGHKPDSAQNRALDAAAREVMGLLAKGMER